MQYDVKQNFKTKTSLNKQQILFLDLFVKQPLLSVILGGYNQYINIRLHDSQDTFYINKPTGHLH